MIASTGKLLGMSASLAALAAPLAAAGAQDAAAPPSAQTKSTSETGVTADQVQGPVGPAQERTGTDPDNPDIVVTGIRASIQASLQAKRASDLVSEVITAQDIGKFPDKNVADSLGRLTGVNVVTGSANAGGFGENQSVSIRGTDPNLNLTLLDGHGIATGDWFVLDQQNGGRSFNFSMLPSEIVGKLEVYKSSEADLPEGGVGGTINVHTRLPLDYPAGTISVTAQEVYNDLANKWTPQVSGVASWKNADDTFGVLVSGFYEKRDFRRDGQEFLGYATVANFDGSGQTVAYPNQIGQAYFRQKRIRKGGDVAIQWKPSDTFEVTATGLYTRMDANNINTNSMAWVNTVVGANSTPGTDAYALTDYSTKTYGGTTYLTSGIWAGTTAAGGPVNGKVQDDIFRTAYSSTWDANLDAVWKPTDHLTVDAEGGYTEGKGATTDTEAWETFWHTGMSYAFDGKHADLSFPDLPSDTSSAAYLDNYYNWSWGGRIVSPDKETYVRADIEEGFDSDWLRSIKVGARYTDHKRSLDYDAYSWAGNGLFSGTNTIGLGTVYDGGMTPGDFSDDVADAPPYSVADRDKVLAELGTNGGRMFAFYPPLSFSVHEKDTAFYAMAKVGDGRAWRGNIGVRAVHTDETSTQYSSNLPADELTISNQFGNFGEIDSSRKYWDVLPSANLTYNVTDKFLVRGAAAKVMSRPGYAQLAGAVSLNDLGLTGTAGGNPDLKPFRAWQYSLNAEWYYAPQALISAGVFYLDIQNWISTTSFTEHFCTQQHPCNGTENGADFTLTGPVNGGGAKNKGFEVSWQQPIAWGFGFIANYTYADAKKNKDAEVALDDYSRTVDGNSKNTYNVTGYFENKWVSARVAWSFRSKFRSGIDRSTPMWQDDFGQLDGSLLIHVTRNADLSFDAQNLLNRKLYYFVGNEAVPRAYYDNGRTFYAGVKLTF